LAPVVQNLQSASEVQAISSATFVQTLGVGFEHPDAPQTSCPLQKNPSSQKANPVQVKPDGQSVLVSHSVRAGLLQVFVGNVVVQESVVSLHLFIVQETPSSH